MESSTTLQQLERTDGEPRDARWDAAFAAQLTDDLADKVAAFAARRARWVERKTGTSDPSLPRELFQDALGDTWSGAVTWDPGRASLELHLKRVIKSRTSHELTRLERFRHISTHRPSVELPSVPT